MTKKKKQKKQAKKMPRGDEKMPRGDEKLKRLAHEILVKKIEPANLTLEEAIDVAVIVVKAIVISNTSDDDPEDRTGMIEWIVEHFVESLMDIDPNVDHAHLWLVPPQGLITEPFGILWDGGYEESSVKGVLGAELTLLRTEYAETKDKTGAIIVEGVEGVAIIVPDWDGEDTVTCANPECGQVHDVHLNVAEELFQQAVERRRQRAAVN